MATIDELKTKWAELLEQARTLHLSAPLEHLAVEVLEDLRSLQTSSDDDLLNLRQAAAASGYSSGYLGRLIREGKLRSEGRPNRPLISRSNLPKKATTLQSDAIRHQFPRAARRLSLSAPDKRSGT